MFVFCAFHFPWVNSAVFSSIGSKEQICPQQLLGPGSAKLVLSSGGGGRIGRRRQGIVAGLVRAKPLHLLLVVGNIYSLSTSFFHVAWCDFVSLCLVVEAVTMIFRKLFAFCRCPEFQLYYKTKCNPTAAFWRSGFISYPIILYSLKICTACAASSRSLSQPMVFCAGWCIKLKELRCLRHPVSAVGVTAEIGAKSEELLLSVHRKQFWALLLC